MSVGALGTPSYPQLQFCGGDLTSLQTAHTAIRKAVEVPVFAEPLRGIGEGHYNILGT